jgi:hypothetical protein
MLQLRPCEKWSKVRGAALSRTYRDQASVHRCGCRSCFGRWPLVSHFCLAAFCRRCWCKVSATLTAASSFLLSCCIMDQQQTACWFVTFALQGCARDAGTGRERPIRRFILPSSHYVAHRKLLLVTLLCLQGGTRDACSGRK